MCLQSVTHQREAVQHLSVRAYFLLAPLLKPLVGKDFRTCATNTMNKGFRKVAEHVFKILLLNELVFRIWLPIGSADARNTSISFYPFEDK